MISLFIAGSDRTSDLERNSLQVTQEMQKKADSCNFRLFQGTEPEDNEEIIIFDGALIESAAGAVMTVNTTFLDKKNNKFRAGDKLWLDAGGSNEEKVTVLTVDTETQLTLTASPANAPSGGEKIAKKIFGGTVANIKDKNVKQLTQLEFSIRGIDFTKIFDRKNVNDSFEDVDARYIMNKAMNGSDGGNYTKTIDDFDYDNNAAIQAAYTEAGDGGNPVIDSADFIEQDASGVFPWTNSGGQASWVGVVTSIDASEWTGVASGTPTQGQLMSWIQADDISNITSIKLQVGSSPTDYIEIDLDLPSADDDGEYVYNLIKLSAGTITGTPDWTAIDHTKIIVDQTGSGSIQIGGFRFVENSAFTFFNFQKGLVFTDLRASFKKPTLVIDRLAKFNKFFWYIDYDRDIHFFPQENESAPFSLTETSNNFTGLSASVDTTNLKNRQVVRGGNKTTTTVYPQVVTGDGAVREWLLKNKFKNLTISLDDNSSTDTMEGGTTTTAVVATAHGLVTGDYIVNRSQANEAREITKVDDDNFTVEAIAGQASGDTFSKFATSKTIGIEGIADETAVDYVSNFNEKSIRATDSEDTLTASDLLLFTYNEVFPIRVIRSDSASIARMKALVGGDGIFDGKPITDRTIDSSAMAAERAVAEIAQFSNPLIKVTFSTDEEGLRAGQTIRIVDSNRSLDESFLIQTIRASAVSGEFGDYFIYSVRCATTLFGIIEFFQKLLALDGELQVDEDEIIEEIKGENVEINIAEVNTFVPTQEVDESATISLGESNSTLEFTPPYKYEPTGLSVSRYNLAEYS